MQSAVNLGWFALIVGGHKAQGGAGSEHHSIKINHQQDHVHPATISVMIIANMITNRACTIVCTQESTTCTLHVHPATMIIANIITEQHLWSGRGRWSRETGCK